MKTAHTFAVVAGILLGVQAVQSSRHLLLTTVPANEAAVESSRNANAGGRAALALIGNASASFTQLVNVTLLAHEAAEQTYATSLGGQVSSTIAANAAAGATLLAAGLALTNNSAAIPEAEAALANADTLVAAVTDENPIGISAATFANGILLFQLGHDGSLIQYFQNETGVAVMDNATFAETAENLASLVEAASDQMVAGAAPGLLAIAAEVTGNNILGAIHVYRGQNEAAYANTVNNARGIIKAVNVVRTGASCNVDAAMAVANAGRAVEAATKAAKSLSDADIAAAESMAQALVQTFACSLSPAMAPGMAAASNGR